MLKLHAAFEERGLSDGSKTHFIHVVITDGQDTCSKMDVEELAGLMLIIGEKIPAEFLKTYFIGVDLESDGKALVELALIAGFGQDTAELFNISNTDIDKVFDRI